MKLQYNELTTKQKMLADEVFSGIRMDEYLYEINSLTDDIMCRHRILDTPKSWKPLKSLSVFQD